MEEARALGRAAASRDGSPSAPSFYCVWDGEEPGLLGSTEWAETHADELQRKAAVYINSDGNGRGYLRRGRLAHAGEVHQRRGARHRRPGNQGVRVEAASGGAIGARDRRLPRRTGRKRARAPDLRIGALGSGSDYTAFLDHLGIASVNLGFGGEDRRRHLPFHLRRFLLVHAFLRHRFRLRPGAGADRRHGGDAAGRRRTAAVRFRRLHRHHAPLHGRSAETGARQARPDRGAQPRRSTKACSPPSRTRGIRRTAAARRPCRRS